MEQVREQSTSTIAYAKYKADGKKERDQKIIVWVLKTYGELTAYGIAKKAFYKELVNGIERIKKLSYVAVERRMKELRVSGLAKATRKIRDDDDALRMAHVAL
ncbi:hypothetical protein [Flagellimonas flava]|uniref:hypothetical protein n=1 Tax=Flagellimonas flava TaxID=570519 RepID=UPI003D661839